MPHTLKQDEFFKFYFIYMLITAVFNTAVSVVPLLLAQPPAASSTVMMILGILSSFMGFAAFVVSIIAIVLVVKRKYPKTLLWLPISSFAMGVIGAVVGLITSVMLFKEQFEALDANPSPAAIQAITDEFAANPPIAITIYAIIRGVVLVGLAVWLLIFSQREVSEVAKK